MRRGFSRHVAAILLFAAVLSASAASVQACSTGWPFKEGRPFRDSYFDLGHTVFRGTAVRYEHLQDAVRITFAVKDTYFGEMRDLWIAVWQNSTFGHPTNLNAFKEEIGEDLIVVLGYPGVTFDPGIPIDLEATVPMVVYEICNEPAMQTFEVMEPMLRARGLIK